MSQSEAGMGAWHQRLSPALKAVTLPRTRVNENSPGLGIGSKWVMRTRDGFQFQSAGEQEEAKEEEEKAEEVGTAGGRCAWLSTRWHCPTAH